MIGPFTPPSLMPQQLPKGTVLDWSGNPVDFKAKPDPESIAKTGRVRDPWLMQMAMDVTPESLARMVRNDYPLPLQMALCNRMIDNDAKLASVYRDLVSAVSGLDWEVPPVDDSSEAAAYAKTCDEWATTKSEELEEAMPLLLAAEFYPMGGIGMRWNLDTFLPESFVEIDPLRWYWEPRSNSLKIRTLAEPWFGEDLPPNEFVLYRSALRPGKGREGGLWRPTSWLYLFKHYTLAEWMHFAEVFGKPFRVAYYNQKEEKDSVYQAMIDLGVNAAGVFPAGTVVDLQEANRTGAVDVYKQLHEVCNDEMSELFVGHSLITHAKSGSGTLAGQGAQKVHEKIVQAVARRLGRVISKYIFRPIVNFHHGPKAVEKTPNFKFKYEPPEDEQKKATTFVLINQALQSVGEAIDPEQIRETFNIAKTVPRTSPAPAPSPMNPGGSGSGGGGAGGGDGIPENSESGQAAASRAAAGTLRIKTPDDVGTVQRQMLHRAVEEFSAKVGEMVQAAPTLKEAADAIVEGYAALDTVRLASGLRDATLTADLMGRGDAGK